MVVDSSGEHDRWVRKHARQQRLGEETVSQITQYQRQPSGFLLPALFWDNFTELLSATKGSTT